MKAQKNNPVDRDKMTTSGGPLVHPYPGPYHIPVLIDDIKRLDQFNMTRCTVFTIEATTAVDDWVALLRTRHIPFLLFGISAVLHRPDLKRIHFTNPKQIDGLFDAIEAMEGLVVETSHIWLPNFIFLPHSEGQLSVDGQNLSATRGAVWRLSFDLFQHALRFSRGAVMEEQFVAACTALVNGSAHVAAYSAQETTTFHLWSVAQIEAARDNYAQQRADPDRKVLDWQDESGLTHAG